MTTDASVPELTRRQRAKFVSEIQRYLRGAEGVLHEAGVDISQMVYDGRSLYIGVDRNRPPSQDLQIREDTIKSILAMRYPDLEVGFRPVEMNPAP